MTTFWWVVLGVWAGLNIATVAVGEIRYRRNVRAARARWENEIDRRTRCGIR
jgi:hypothetical protein